MHGMLSITMGVIAAQTTNRILDLKFGWMNFSEQKLNVSQSNRIKHSLTYWGSTSILSLHRGPLETGTFLHRYVSHWELKAYLLKPYSDLAPPLRMVLWQMRSNLDRFWPEFWTYKHQTGMAKKITGKCMKKH